MNTQSKGRGRWFVIYTGLFLFGALVLVVNMLRCGKLLIWQPDGFEQHYTVIGYVGKLVRGLLAGKRIPMMNFTLGQGMDVLTTCAYYGYTDPLNLLAAFANEGSYGIAYVGISLLRVYLAGIAFALYAKKVGARDQWALGCSAAIYTFSGYFLLLLGRHPYFLNGGLYLPLLLLAIERVFDERKWLIYTLVTALMLIVNFYFAYMNTIVAILYIMVRLIARLKQRGVGESARDGFILLGGYLLGAAMAAVVFLPIALVYLRNGRLGVSAGYSGSMLHYPLKFYLDTIAFAFVGRKKASLFTSLSYAPLALFGIMGLYLRGQENAARSRQIRIALYLCAIVAGIPILGKVMNGMAYVTNRWIYVMALFVSLGCCFGLPQLFREDAPRRALGALALVYAVFCAGIIVKGYRLYFLVGAMLLVATGAMVFLWGTARFRRFSGHHARIILTLALAVMLAGNICLDYFIMGNEYVSVSNGDSSYSEVASRAKAHLIDDPGVYRTGQGAYNDANSMLLGYMGTSYYWSLVDQTFSEYYQALWLPSLKTNYNYFGFFGNNSMNAVASVKYFVRGEGEDYLVPYGFNLLEDRLALPNGTSSEVYENEYALPLGYTYDAVLSQAEYDALPVEKKLQALTHCAIVADPANLPLPALGAERFEGIATDIPYEVASAEGVELLDGKIRAEKDGRLSLSFKAPEDAAIYLMADGMRPNREIYDGDYGRLTIVTADGTSQDVMPTPYSNFYYPKSGSAYCLGFSALDHCDILFTNDMCYDCNELRVVAIPLEGYREDMRRRREAAMRDIRLSEDRIRGSVSAPDKRILQIAVPFSEGWRAWVDGVEQPVFRCGGLYMGILLNAGDHDIEMRYATPGLLPGAVISIVALLATLALAVIPWLRRQRKEGAK